jgi:TonB family protein
MQPKNLGKKEEFFSGAILPSGKRRWRSFGAGFTIEIAILACAIWIPMLFPEQMVAAKQYLMTEITAPPIDTWKPKPVVRPRPAPVKRVEMAKVEPVPDPPKPKIIEPVFEKPVAPKPVVRKIVRAPELNEWAKAVPETNPLGSSAMPDLKKPRAPVETGGFGDPNGLPATDKIQHVVNLNQTGAFDMPPGPGRGNGTGGAKGREGIIASAGFGNDVATSGASRRGGTVEAGGFANQTIAASGPRVRKASDTTPVDEGVVILSKPQPEYTAEARQEKIQGEVLLQVVFTATGHVDVERIVKGLGHGLDENAEVAAREIKFTPAKRNGQPVDFPAIVRIDFELAY